jgi:hypothetical protein
VEEPLTATVRGETACPRSRYTPAWTTRRPSRCGKSNARALVTVAGFGSVDLLANLEAISEELERVETVVVADTVERAKGHQEGGWPSRPGISTS